MSTSAHRETAMDGKSLGAAGGIVLLASATRTAATVDGATITNHNFAKAPMLACMCNLTASVAPTTLDVAVEASMDGGTNWYIIAKFSQYGAVSSGQKWLKVGATASQAFGNEVVASASPSVTGAAVANNFTWDSLLRASYVLVGTSYTFSVIVVPILTT